MAFKRVSADRVLSVSKKFIDNMEMCREMAETHAEVYSEMKKVHAGQIINVNRKHKDKSLILQTIPIAATPLKNEENVDKIDIFYYNLYEEAIKILNHNIEVIVVANQLCKLFRPYNIDEKSERYDLVQLSLKDVESISSKLKKLKWLPEDVEIPLDDAENFIASAIYDKLNTLQYSYDENQKNHRRAKINYGKGQSLNPINSTLANILTQSKEIVDNIESLLDVDKLIKISSTFENKYKILSNKKSRIFKIADTLVEDLNNNEVNISNLLKIDNDYINEISKVKL